MKIIHNETIVSFALTILKSKEEGTHEIYSFKRSLAHSVKRTYGYQDGIAEVHYCTFNRDFEGKVADPIRLSEVLGLITG